MKIDFNTVHKLAIQEKLKPFKCEVCEKSFYQKHELKKQKLAIHEKSKPFKCELCEKSFSHN